jgi:ferric-chelate reductase
MLMRLSAAMTLGPKPYYWPTDANYGSSPPIATRAGWMALALLPFVLYVLTFSFSYGHIANLPSVLSAKANMVSALTGIPPEKLQVFHHWTSYAMFVLALVHTFPYIIFHIRKGDMVKQWKTSVVYWTGIPALLSQTYLTVMSLPPIRYDQIRLLDDLYN